MNLSYRNAEGKHGPRTTWHRHRERWRGIALDDAAGGLRWHLPRGTAAHVPAGRFQAPDKKAYTFFTSGFPNNPSGRTLSTNTIIKNAIDA